MIPLSEPKGPVESEAMNHGVVMFQREAFETRLWQMAMSRGQFVAIYTARCAERSADGTFRELWQSTLVPTTGEPLHWPPYPDLGGNYVDYGRYEPAYDAQFLEMCRHCASYYGFQTAVVPSTAGDKEAMALFEQFDSIQETLYDKFYDLKCAGRRIKSTLADLIKPIFLHNGWAYLLGIFGRRDPIVVFLSDSYSDVESLLKPDVGQPTPVRKADWLDDYGVIEKW
jgi:hypothetical protein